MRLTSEQIAKLKADCEQVTVVPVYARSASLNDRAENILALIAEREEYERERARTIAIVEWRLRDTIASRQHREQRHDQANVEKYLAVEKELRIILTHIGAGTKAEDLPEGE